MNPLAHVGYVPALRDFQRDLADFAGKAAGHVKSADTAARTVEQHLAHDCSFAAARVHHCRDRHAEAVSGWNLCVARNGRGGGEAACEFERPQVEEAAADLVRAEAVHAALHGALARLSAAIEVFRVERACLEKVVDCELTAADQSLKMSLVSIEAYLGQAHRR